jgi:hypothetical protein
MLTSIKRVLILLTVLTMAAVLWVLFYSKGRTYYNDASETGNTTGNIYNGGLFCEQDNTIFFSNDEDGGRLYRMNSDCTDIKKVSDALAVYINADDNYIYYALANDTTKYNEALYSFYNNNGIFRINRNGKKLKAITGDPGAFLMLKGNSLFFERYNVKNGYTLATFQIDGTAERTLIDTFSVPIDDINNYLYYVGDAQGTNIDAIELSSYTKHTYYNGSFAYPVFMGDYLYYINPADDNRLYRMNKNGTGNTLLVDQPCSAYNITISGKYLYYQLNGTKKGSLCRLNTETLESETVKKGNYKEIHVTKKYVFFKSLDSTTTYRLDADGKVFVDVFYSSLEPTAGANTTPSASNAPTSTP